VGGFHSSGETKAETSTQPSNPQLAADYNHAKKKTKKHIHVTKM
jgi:hypothetical protein